MEDNLDARYESLPVIDRVLTKVECIGVEKRTKPSKHQVYVLVVTWSDGVKYPIYRRYISFFDLKVCLKEEFKDRPGYQEPELPALKLFERGWLFGNKDTAIEKRKKYINKFCQQVMQLPEDMVRSNTVMSFHETWESDFGPDSSQRRVSMPSALSSLNVLPENHSGRRGSQPQIQGRYFNRDIPDIIEVRGGRPRSTSLTQGPDPSLLMTPSARTSNSHSLPRGASLDSSDQSLLDNQYKVTSDYERRRPGEVSMKEGQIVEVLERNMTGWWFVHKDGAGGRAEQGWAPGAFLVPAIPDHSRRPESHTDFSGNEELVGEYETVCEYHGQHEDEVSYTTGQHLHVTKPAADGWWKVRLPDNQEGYTPAINLQKSEQKPSTAASSTFQKRSLRGRGPPPRSQSVKETPETASTPTSEVPVYARIRRPGVKKVTTQRKSLSDFGESPYNQGSRRLSLTQDKMLNYTEIVFTPVDEDLHTKFTERWQLKRKDKVEYAEINPQPLSTTTDKQKGTQKHQGACQSSHVYVNVGAPDDHVTENITLEKERSHQTDSLYTYTPPRNQLSPMNTDFQKDSSSHQPPVPKPRRPVKQQTLHNYENAEILKEGASLTTAHPTITTDTGPQMSSSVIDTRITTHCENDMESVINDHAHSRSDQAHQPLPTGGSLQTCVSIGNDSARAQTGEPSQSIYENQPWFMGQISRQHAEHLLLQHGYQRDFLIRKSTNRVGDLTLSVRYEDRVRHFPIQMTSSGKYDIGKTHFPDLIKVISYYQNNPLFFDKQADNAPVSLGTPLKHTKSD